MNNTVKSMWVYCPDCKAKTKTKIYADSVLIHFPLYCPRCKKEMSVDIIQQKIYASPKEKNKIKPGFPKQESRAFSVGRGVAYSIVFVQMFD